MRWARALAIVGVYLLALQSLNLPRLFVGESAPCCCSAKGEACHCPICSHNRDRASCAPMLSHCPDPSPQPFVAQLDLVLPVVQQRAFEKPQQQLPQLPQPEMLPDPNREVPTPPPLV